MSAFLFRILCALQVVVAAASFVAAPLPKSPWLAVGRMRWHPCSQQLFSARRQRIHRLFLSSNNNNNDKVEEAGDEETIVVVRGSDEDFFSAEQWEDIEEAQPSQLMVMKEVCFSTKETLEIQTKY
jgi:hypothetical protein